MQTIISLNERGTLTLPAGIRKSLGITSGQQFTVATTPSGELLLSPVTTIPFEIYSEERIAEFAEEDSAIGRILSQHQRKK